MTNFVERESERERHTHNTHIAQHTQSNIAKQTPGGRITGAAVPLG